jgi:hypothetical protein
MKFDGDITSVAALTLPAGSAREKNWGFLGARWLWLRPKDQDEIRALEGQGRMRCGPWGGPDKLHRLEVPRVLYLTPPQRISLGPN